MYLLQDIESGGELALYDKIFTKPTNYNPTRKIVVRSFCLFTDTKDKPPELSDTDHQDQSTARENNPWTSTKDIVSV